MQQQHLPKTLKHCAGCPTKLPKQMDPNDFVKDLHKGLRTAAEQKGEISCGANHHVPIALATVTRTTFLMTVFVQ